MIHRQIARRALGLVAAAVLAAGAAQAQTAVDGAVAGTVVDSSGAALPKAGVVVHSTATNADTKVTADASGYFRASRLVPGDYTVMVTAPGFSSYTAEHVIVEVGKLTEVMPKLGTGSASTTVEVTAENPVINQEQSDFTTEFNPTTLATLPINGRHWTSFALLSPGVTLGNSAFGLVSFRGSSNLQNNFLVDGVDDNDAFQSVERGYTRVGYSTPEDAILEFVVNTSNFSAINGRATGGGVNAVTRSGSNIFHGDAFYYYRDNDFGATNPFSILQTVPTTVFIKPKDKRSQYGGSFNGPLIHDKLFFLYAFDQQKRNFPIVAVPTPQFLSYTNASYDSCPNAAGGAAVNAEVCAEARGVTPAQVAAAESFIAQQSGIAPRLGDQIINFVKFDYLVTPKNQISLAYDRMRWDSPNGIQTNAVVRRGLTSLGNDYDKVDSVIGKITTLIAPSTSNELRVGYGREFDTENGDKPGAGEPTTTAGGLPPGAAITGGGGTFTIGTPSYIPRSNYPDERVIETADNITYSHGQHTVNAGVDYHYVQDNVIDVDYLHGVFTYSQVADFFTDYARFLGNTTVGCNPVNLHSNTGGAAPCYTSLTQAFGRAQFVYHTGEYAGYVQDDWKILKHLTLNLGVRYDYEQLPKAKIPSLIASASLTGQMPSDKNNFAPRIGFAWDIYGTGKTVLHGAYGIYYGRIENGMIFRSLLATGSPNSQFQLTTSVSSATYATAPQYPTIVSTATPPLQSNIQAFGPHFQNPYTHQAQLSLQQDLGYKTVLGIAYLGSFGRELPNLVDTNIAPATSTTTYTFNGGPLAGQQWTVPHYTVRQNVFPAATTPGSGYYAFTQMLSNLNSSYNALAVSVDHRLAQGVQLQASYTWSHSLDFNINQTAVPADTNDPTDPFSAAPDYGRSANDIPQRFTGDITLEPTFSLKNKIVSYVANGWTLAPVWTVQSGIPYSLVFREELRSRVVAPASTARAASISSTSARTVTWGPTQHCPASRAINTGSRTSMRSTLVCRAASSLRASTN
jgi:hypothetical protein